MVGHVFSFQGDPVTILLDTIAAETAQLQRLVPVPVAPFGYGVDLSCVSDLTPTMAEVDAFSPLGVAQACARRLQTQRGTLADDLAYGLDVRGMLNTGVTASELRDMQGQIRSELLKDDRIADLAASVSMPSTNALTVQIRITPADPNASSFSFTLAVTSAQVILEAIG